MPQLESARRLQCDSNAGVGRCSRISEQPARPSTLVQLAKRASVPCDVTDHDQVVAAASTVGEHTGGTLDLLINNADTRRAKG